MYKNVLLSFYLTSNTNADSLSSLLMDFDNFIKLPSNIQKLIC